MALKSLAELPVRTVLCMDAIEFLTKQTVLPGSVITCVFYCCVGFNTKTHRSIPDTSEIPHMGLAEYKVFFESTARLIMSRVPPNEVAIFYQSDIKVDGQWLDKGFLVQKAAEAAGCALLWHKIALIAPAGSSRYGRPTYSHMLCFSRDRRDDRRFSTADVLPTRGAMLWPRGMGLDACDAAVRYCQVRVQSQCIVDPFCGVGSVLAIANEFGLKAVGVDLSVKRTRMAERLTAQEFRQLARKPRGDAPASKEQGERGGEGDEEQDTDEMQ